MTDKCQKCFEDHRYPQNISEIFGSSNYKNSNDDTVNEKPIFIQLFFSANSYAR